MAEELLKGVQSGIAELFNDGKKDEDGRRGEIKLSDVVHENVRVEKSSVLLSTRAFHDSIKVVENPEEMAAILTKLLVLENGAQTSGQRLSGGEATEVFFAATKLFVSSAAPVKRLVYLFIKEVCGRVEPSDAIIVTSCLTKDMTCGVEAYRANALRVLVHIIDSAMLGAIERYVKQAIQDQSPVVASAALVSALHFFRSCSDSAAVVRRWVREISEARASPHPMVQFHATQLLYQLKAADRLAVSKFVQTAAAPKRPAPQSPLAAVCLLRYTARLVHDEVHAGRANTALPLQTASQLAAVCYRLLEAGLRHEAEMVRFEAARALCALPGVQAEDVRPALCVLQVLLSSARPATRVGALRALDGLSAAHPRLVARFNEDLEALIGDSNRLIGTLAIVTLLKTASDHSVDRLLKSIHTFLFYIADEYKVIVVNSLRDVCLLFPHKHSLVVAFLGRFLREDGGFAFKATIVDTILSLLHKLHDAKDASLLYLCEFVEDCEYTALSTQVLHAIADIAPQTLSPSRYVRFIYNRVILENATVRAAAVSALAKFAAARPELRASIVILLRHSLNDDDDEARDRAVLALSALEAAEQESPYVETIQDEDSYTQHQHQPQQQQQQHTDNSATFLLLTQLPFSFDNLQRRLELYQATPGAMDNPEPLSITVLPVVPEEPPHNPANSNTLNLAPNEQSTSSDPSQSYHLTTSHPKKLEPSAILYAIPEFATFGRVFKSSTPVPLTENEAEYVVHCIKHTYQDNIVLQFIVQNTIQDLRLTDVSVAVDTQSTLFTPTGEIPADTIAYGPDNTASCFTVLSRNKDTDLTSVTLLCELKFMLTQLDPDTKEEQPGVQPLSEEYALENLDIHVADYFQPTPVRDFKRSWANAAGDGEVLQKFSLARQKNVEGTVQTIIQLMGLQVCDGTGRVRPNARQHMVHLSGTFLDGVDVLARAQVSIAASSSDVAILKIAVRSSSADVSRIVADSVS